MVHACVPHRGRVRVRVRAYSCADQGKEGRWWLGGVGCIQIRIIHPSIHPSMSVFLQPGSSLFDIPRDLCSVPFLHTFLLVGRSLIDVVGSLNMGAGNTTTISNCELACRPGMEDLPFPPSQTHQTTVQTV